MRISLMSVGMDLGADRRGVDIGPSAILYAGLSDKLRALGHEVEHVDAVSVPERETREVGEPKLKYLDPIIAIIRETANHLAHHLDEGTLPIVLGGDHSIALGSVGGVARVRHPIGLIWFDAHGDFNTNETTPSGNIHGMILAALCGLGDPRLVDAVGPDAHVEPSRAVIVGARDLDVGERELLRAAGVRVYTMAEIDQRGMADVTREAIELAGRDTNGIHLSFDMDAVDPSEAPGVGTPVPGGVTYREAHLAMELIAASGRLIALDMVEVNPILDRENRTAILASELILSAVGKTIL
jgi:arginase